MQLTKWSSLVFFFFLAIYACNNDKSTDRSMLDEKDDLASVNAAPISQLEAGEIKADILDEARQVVKAIAGRDMEKLSGYVHPVEGLRISPYAYVDLDKHLIFTAQQIAGLMKVDSQYIWGNQDGTGDPIKLTPAEFFDQYLYDKDYLQPDKIGYDEVIGGGNSPYNFQEIYKTGHLVEFYLDGKDPQYDGMDWGSLIMIFSPYQGKWYLQSIAHGQWTI